MNSGRVTFEHKARLKQILTCVSWENTTHPCVHRTHTYVFLYFVGPLCNGEGDGL